MKILKRTASLVLALLMVSTLLPSDSMAAFADAVTPVKTGSEVQGFDANTVCTEPWGTDYANDPFGLATGFSIVALGNITEPGNGSHMIGPAAAEGTMTGLQQLTVEEGAVDGALAINGWTTKPLDRFNVAGILNNSRPEEDKITMLVKNGDLVYSAGTDYRSVQMDDSEGHIIAQTNTQQFFDNARAYLTASEALLKSLPANGTVVSDNWTVTLSGTADDDGVSVFDYTPSGTNGKAFVFDIPNDDSTIVVRVHGDKPNLAVQSAWYPNYSSMISYANPASAEIVQRIIWVFDDNAEIKASGEIPGSIMGTTASASLATNSSFNGTVVLKNFNAEAASAEIHWLPFRGGKKVAVTGNIVITKTGETEALDGTYTELDGALFDIYDVNPDENATAQPIIENVESGKTYNYDYKTQELTQDGGEAGVLRVNGLPVGEYWAKEVSAPDGYIKDDSTLYLGKIEATGDEIGLPELTNDRVKGDLTIYKAGEKGLENTEMVALKGVTYNIYRSDDNILEESELVATETTDKDGKIYLENLPEGSYYAQEVSAPDGYIVDDSVHFIGTISEDNASISNVNAVFTNNLYRGSIVIIKRGENGAALSGVKFELYRKADGVFEWLANLGDVKIGEYTTDANGKITVENLPFGEYYVKETEALGGYKELSGKISLGTITASNLSVTAEIENEKIYGSAKIEKTDSDKNPISGVTFALYRVSETGDEFIENLVEDTENPGTYISTKLLEAGNYYVVETNSPLEYVLPTGDAAKTELQELTESRTVITTVNKKPIVNTEVTGSLVVIKKDADTQAVLEGAEFTLYNDNDANFKKTATTDANGEAKFENLPAGGGYYIIETKAPQGYQLDQTRIDVTGEINRNKTELTSVTAYDKAITGSAYVTKVDQNGSAISGVTFMLYKADDESFVPQTAVTDENGVARWNDLPLGKYYVVETDAPAKYILPTGSAAKTELQELTENRTEITAANGKAIVNSLAEGEITVIKQDSSNPDKVEYLEGAVFELYNENDVKVATLTTGADGKATFTGIPSGTYYLVEAQAPQGYVSVGKLNGTITVDRSNTAISYPVENSKIIGSASLEKVDQDGKPLAGVVFTLYKAEDPSFALTATTDENGKASWSNLGAGTYYAKETTPLGGYAAETNTQYAIGTITTNGQHISRAAKVVNTLITGSIVLTKNGEENVSVDGIVFELFRADTNESCGKKTITNGKARWDSLTVGSYYLREISDNSGMYQTISGNISVTEAVTTLGQVINVSVDNSLVRGGVEITKTGEAGDSMQGAEFKLYTEDGVELATLTTDENGKASYDGLKMGSYYLVETKAPQGYKADSAKIPFTLTREKATAQLNIVNSKVYGSITITKTGENNVSVDGIRFSLYKQAGTAPDETVDTLVETRAVENGSVTWTGLPIGTYYAVENAFANINYAYSAEPIAIGTITEGNTQIGITVNNRLVRGTVKITKVGEAGDSMQGAEFDLYTADGVKVNTAPIVTGENGMASFANLPVGSYYLVETKAPQGYTFDASQKYNFTITRDQNNPSANVEAQVTVTNEKVVIYGDVTITKTGEDNVPVDGIRFSLYKQAGDTPNTAVDTLVGTKTVTNGKASWTGLSVGTYYAIEDASTAANYAYSAEPIAVGTIADGSTDIKITVNNSLVRGKVAVTKVNSNGKALQGAEFDLYTADGTKVNTAPIVTDENGYAEFDGLKAGNYYLLETKAPQGCILPTGEDAKTEFAIVRDSADTTIGKLVSLRVENAVGRGEATLIKVDADTNAPLAGAVFGLYEKAADAQNNTNAIATATTDENGKITFTNLECGKEYFTAEISAPENYITQKNVTGFTVTNDGESIVIGTFTNTAMSGSVIINKRDAENTELALGGAVFGLYATAADAQSRTNPIATATSATDGTVVFNGLRIGTYYAAEITAPYNYKLSDEVLTVQITANALQPTYTYCNTKKVVYKVTYHSNNSQYDCVEEQSTDNPYYEDGAPWTVKSDVDNGQFNFRTPGYVFDGWYLNPDCTGEKLTIDDIHNIQGADVDIWASWKKNPGLPEDRISLDIQHNYYLDGTNSEGSQAENMTDYAPAGSQIDASKLLQEKFNDIDYSVIGTITLIKTPITSDPDTLFPPTPETMYQFDEDYKNLVDEIEKAKVASPDDMTNDDIEAEKTKLDNLKTELDTLKDAAAKAEEDLNAANEALNAFTPADPDNLTEEETAQKNALQQAADDAAAAKSDVDSKITAKEEEIDVSEKTLESLKSQEVVKRYDDAVKALEDMEASQEYADKKAQLDAKNAAEQQEYDDYIKKMRDWYGKDIKPETITLKEGETFLYEKDYAYKLIYNYNRVTPPPTPVDPPVITPDEPTIPPVTPPTTPVTPPPTTETIPDNPIPTGSTPRRNTYTIADDDVPLGSLPNTSGKRAGAVGAAGVLSVIAGALLGIFGKKKKNDEEQ